MPIDYKRYPPNWHERRLAILDRADNKCEFCGVKNYAVGYKNNQGKFIECFEVRCGVEVAEGIKTIQIILTIAHLDHDEENWDVKDERLAALCQKCHLDYDREEKAKRGKNKKAIGDLFMVSN